MPWAVAARVNEHPVVGADVERMVAVIAEERRRPSSPEDRALVLDRLIDQELLIQRGLELGLARSDARIRGELTRIVVDAATREAGELFPDDDELHSFYRDNVDFFRGPDRLHVREVFVGTEGRSDDEARRIAEQAGERLAAGEPFAVVVGELGDARVVGVPDVPLPPSKLSDYLGPSALATAQTLTAGEVSRPVRSTGGYRVLWCVSRTPGVGLAFADAHDQVLAEYRRRAADLALADYLAELRARADIVYAEKR